MSKNSLQPCCLQPLTPRMAWGDGVEVRMAFVLRLGVRMACEDGVREGMRGEVGVGGEDAWLQMMG